MDKKFIKVTLEDAMFVAKQLHSLASNYAKSSMEEAAAGLQFTAFVGMCETAIRELEKPGASKDSTGGAVVDPTHNYVPIDHNAPFGGTVVLCRKDAGRAIIGTLTHKEAFYDHWAPCPTFKKD